MSDTSSKHEESTVVIWLNEMTIELENQISTETSSVSGEASSGIGSLDQVTPGSWDQVPSILPTDQDIQTSPVFRRRQNRSETTTIEMENISEGVVVEPTSGAGSKVSHFQFV